MGGNDNARGRPLSSLFLSLLPPLLLPPLLLLLLLPQAVGVALDGQGAIKVDEFSRTNVPDVWAVSESEIGCVRVTCVFVCGMGIPGES